MIIPCESEQKTMQTAQELASRLEENTRRPLVVCLHGDLGMGKSVFARALIRRLAKNEALEVPSPTFTLLQTYETKAGPLYHFDLYRLKAPEEIYDISWEDALSDGIALIEWPEKLEHLKPPGTLDIHIRPGKNGPHSREIQIIEDHAGK